MKLHPLYSLLLAAIPVISLSVYGQGTLTPPGPPAPTMKSLDQVASTGIAINATNTPGDSADLYVISSPGAYYLTGNVNGVSGKNGILINATNVSLDLNGFALLGVGGSLAAITDGGVNHGNANIRRGSIAGWGGNGIDLSHSFGSLVADLVVTSNGGVGVTLGDTCVLRDCMIRVNSGDGVDAGNNATVIHCSSVGSGNGIGFSLGSDSTLTACTANFNKSNGIVAAVGCNLSNCSTSQNVASGIVTGDGAVLTSCTAYKNASYGIICGNGSQLTGCGAYKNAGGSTTVAIFSGYGSTLTDCAVSGNSAQYGILVNPYSTLVHCTASQNTSDQAISAGIIADVCTVTACTCCGNLTTNTTVTGTTGMGIYCSGRDSLIEHCTCAFNVGDGINVVDRCILRANLANDNTGSGVHITGTDSRVEGNEIAGNTGNGIRIDSTINVVVGNKARSNTAANYNIAAGNRVAAILSPAVTVGVINGDTGGINFATDVSSNLVH